VARGVIQIRRARFGIDGKELIDKPDNAHRLGTMRVQLHRFHEFSSRVRPTARVHRLRPARRIVNGISIALQETIEIPWGAGTSKFYC
jgi:hypothetical protein